MMTRIPTPTRSILGAVLFLILVGGASASAQVTVTPAAPPVATAGQTITFTASVAEGGGVTWSCPHCKGTIDATTGVYTAPSAIHSQQSYGGYQLLPNDHIYNTRVDSLPVNANSATWIAGSGTVPFSYDISSFPVNYCTSATCPGQSMNFYYTPVNNGTYEVPVYPWAQIENGWLSALSGIGSIDHHLLSIDTNTGMFTEFYQYVPSGNVAGCAACNSVSGLSYLPWSYQLPANGSTDAAGLYIMPLVAKLQELERAVATGGTINHAIRMTLANGYICDSSNANACGGNAAGTRHIWPATQESMAGGGTVPYGARFRLKSSFNISGYSPIAQILLTQLKQYGVILADGGASWSAQAEKTYWPQAYVDAFNSISIPPSNFEAVDESGLMLSTSSGATALSETVVATGIKNPSHTASRQVVLTGVALNLPKDELYVQAGAAPQALLASVHGSTNNGVTWTMNPSVGTLNSSTGAYTPPAAISSATRTTITATSNADSSVSASLTMTVLPNGTIYLVLGQTSPFTDTSGHVWQSLAAGDVGPSCIYTDPGNWPSTANILLYERRCQTGDLRFDIAVPNGTYNVTGLFAESDPSVTGPGQRLFNIETQGNMVATNYDIYAAAGGPLLPTIKSVPATVTNGMLSYVLRFINQHGTRISALEIVPVSLSGAPAPPSPPTGVQVIVH
jgi:hypothetical protein